MQDRNNIALWDQSCTHEPEHSLLSFHLSDLSLKTICNLVTFFIYPTNPSPHARFNFPFHIIISIFDDPLSSLHVATFWPWFLRFFRFWRSGPGVHNVIDCWCWHRKIWKRVRSNNENIAPIVRLSVIDINGFLSSFNICLMNHGVVIIFTNSLSCWGIKG